MLRNKIIAIDRMEGLFFGKYKLITNHRALVSLIPLQQPSTALLQKESKSEENGEKLSSSSCDFIISL